MNNNGSAGELAQIQSIAMRMQSIVEVSKQPIEVFNSIQDYEAPPEWISNRIVIAVGLQRAGYPLSLAFWISERIPRRFLSPIAGVVRESSV